MHFAFSLLYVMAGIYSEVEAGGVRKCGEDSTVTNERCDAVVWCHLEPASDWVK